MSPSTLPPLASPLQRKNSLHDPCTTTPTTYTVLASTPGTGSYVEGDTFDDPLQEIEALGGDPFFLESEEIGGDKQDKTDFLWDGEVDENAHLDLDLE